MVSKQSVKSFLFVVKAEVEADSKHLEVLGTERTRDLKYEIRSTASNSLAPCPG